MATLLTSCRHLQRLDGRVQRGLLGHVDVKLRLEVRYDAVATAITLTAAAHTRGEMKRSDEEDQ